MEQLQPGEQKRPGDRGRDLSGTESVPCRIRINVMAMLPSNRQRQVFCTDSGAVACAADSMVGRVRSLGNAATISHMISHPPTRLASSVPLHSLPSWARLARPATTVVTDQEPLGEQPAAASSRPGNRSGERQTRQQRVAGHVQHDR